MIKNQQYKNYLLSKRISCLEKYIFDSKVTANIFSKNIESVKKAIEEGVDVNSGDKYGRTPLVSICASKNPDVNIAKLLLDNGANPNSYSAKKDMQCLSLAINKSQNVDLINLLIDYKANITPQGVISPIYLALDSGVDDAECLFSLIPESYCLTRNKFKDLFDEILKSCESHKISEATASKLVDLLIESTDIKVMLGSVSSNLLRDCDSIHLVYPFLDRNIWPFDSPITSNHSTSKLSNSDQTYILESIKRILKTDLSTVYNIYIMTMDMLTLVNNLDESTDFISQSAVNKIVSNINDGLKKYLILDAIVRNDSEFLNLVINACKGKLKSSDFDYIIETADLKDISDEIARQIIRLIRLSNKKDDLIITNSVLSTKNKILLDFIKDQGYIENISKPRQKDSDIQDKRKHDDSILKYGILYITKDNHPNVTNLFNKYPDLVNIEEFYKEAVKLSKDSFNARQAVRYIDSLKPKKPEKSDDEFSGYDM